MRRSAAHVVAVGAAVVLAACSGGGSASSTTTTKKPPTAEEQAYCDAYRNVVGTLEAAPGAEPPDDAFFANVTTLRDDAPEAIAEQMATATVFYEKAGQLLAGGGTREQLIELGNADSAFMSASFAIGGWVDGNCPTPGG